MTGRYHAYIIPDGAGFKVRPAVAIVDRLGPEGADGSTSFLIRNLTAYETTVSFAGRSPLPPGVAKRKSLLRVPPGEFRAIPLGKHASGLYTYDVTVGPSRAHGLSVKARGESGPALIIDP